MATRGMLAISDGKKVHNQVIGLIPDGSIQNLKYAAGLFQKTANNLGLKEKIESFDAEAINTCLDETVKLERNWFFVDNYSNVPDDLWCEHSVVLNVKTGKYTVYDGKIGS